MKPIQLMDRTRKIWSVAALALWVGLVASPPGVCTAAESDADQDNPHLWKPRATSVAVFKNGLGFFMREGEVVLRDGWCVSRHIPPAAFGTLAIFAHDEDQLVDIVGSGKGEIVDFDDVDAPKTEAAKRQRIEACMNLKVQLSYKQDTQTLTAAGELRSVGPKYIILQADSSNFAVPLADVTRLEVLDLPVRVHVTTDGGKAPAKAKLGMAYLRKGITWIPEYTLKVLDEETAELTLRGTLVNEAEDLVHCDVNFVVGVPHFIHTDFMAPIAVGQAIRTIGTAVAPRQVQSQMMNRAAIVSNTLRSSAVVSQPVKDAGGDLGGALGNLPQMAGPAATDYTVYTKKDLTIRRGEKAIVTLFRRKITYSHIYRWSPPGAMRHHLVLHNTTDTAWTTGPCLAVSDGRPLSEDLLKYVPRGGTGELPVTTSINVAHEQIDSEIERKLKAHEPARHFYVDLVTLRGELKLKNFEKRPVTVVITAQLPGKPLNASDEGRLSVNTRKLKLLERLGSIEWKVKLASGETKTLTYSYERYVPSQ